MKNTVVSFSKNQGKKSASFLSLFFKKKYSTRYNTEVWVFNPFAVFASPGKASPTI
jgi:hypothetical protein